MTAPKILPITVNHWLQWIAAALFCLNTAVLLADSVEEYTAKSLLTLNLARFSEWPPEVFKADATTVDLCLLGDDAIFQVFKLIDQKPVGNKKLSLHDIGGTKKLENCNLLYISAESNNISGLIEESYKRHILTIGETEDFLVKGGAVYLEMANAKITLHVNISATEKAGIRISSRVLKLATIFNP